MSTDPHRMESTEEAEDARPTEDAAMRAAVDAYMEATAAESAAAAEGEAEAENQAAQASPEELAAALEAAKAEADEQRTQALRARADIENLRRRHNAELEKAHKYALDGFVRELLQVRDSLELGHQAALDASVDIDKLREGTELTLKLLGDTMDKFGVAQVDPLDQPFDPELHQAMSMQPRADVAPNTVVAVIQKGYTLNGRLVRPALVMVSQQAS
ncbi:nucleotide exchange factor GrpE [Imhoffiella purpurea]|uniref:Protein GrpE n=1 Tax=Imhoffiella purpurea TaxID=1249627 RepID=W9V4H4_9GAMM|nr:nucleotide exchange factor GrpE [Imhoffiella purpurea]EXJ14249.1 Heat shock protein GrpE [Imhoffiella purpurea]